MTPAKQQMQQGMQAQQGCIGHSAKANILIVDDNPRNLMALRAIFIADDRNVVTVSSGEQALKYVLDKECCVVVLDVKMDGMDGYETAAMIRSRERTRDLPIIFMTSYSKDEADVVKGYSYGAVDYIFKPIVPQILLAKINVFVDLYKKTTDLKRKNDELERAEKELLRTRAAASLIKHAPDPVFVSDLQGHILQVNDAASELLGLRAEQLIEQSLSEFIPQQEMQEFIAAFREIVERGVTRNMRLNPRNSMGEVIPTMLNASALRDQEGKVIGAIAILRDMRAYEAVVRDLEQSQELSALKSAFVSIVSHEVRTPMTSIKAFVDNMLEGVTGPLNAKQVHCLSRIKHNVDRLTRMLNELLDLSKIEAGKIKLQLNLTSVQELINNVIDGFRPSAEERSITLQWSPRTALPSIICDRDKVQQILINLLENAIKFTPHGGAVSVESQLLDDTVLKICVADTGPGIAEEEVGKIFDKFYRGRFNPAVVSGAGLGLSIVKSLVELHGGTISVESHAERGSRFCFTLPSARPS